MRLAPAPEVAAAIADLLATGHSYNATAHQLGLTKWAVTLTVRYWRAHPDTVPDGHPDLLTTLATRYRNPGPARAAKDSEERKRALAEAARHRADLIGRIAAGQGVPMDVAEQMLLDAERAAVRAARVQQVQALTPPLRPEHAARRLPNGIHPRSARAIRLGSTRTPRRAYAWPVGSAVCVAGR